MGLVYHIGHEIEASSVVDLSVKAQISSVGLTERGGCHNCVVPTRDVANVRTQSGKTRRNDALRACVCACVCMV
jgi:hypothetical protein